MSDNSRAILPPTPVAREYLRLVRGFGVGVVLGLAPFLGTLPIPGFPALLTLYPNESRFELVTMGAFLMGVVPVVVQFYVGERLSGASLRRWFRRTTLTIVLALASLTVLVNLCLEKIPTAHGTMSFLIVGERLSQEDGCPCPKRMPDVTCLLHLGAGGEGIPLCWDKKLKRLVNLALFGSYFLLTGGFGTMIGLVILQRAAKQQQAARKSQRRRSSEKGSRGKRAHDAEPTLEAAATAETRPKPSKGKRTARRRKAGEPAAPERKD